MKKRFGVMLDCSRNAVMSVSSVKKYADYLSSFGYNTIMLYTEDTYEVNNEPYFGYMRGRYTKAELKDLDAYCASKGIELIPCIQTLAHLNAIFKWPEYDPCHDLTDILLVEEERTSRLIANMMDTLCECFTSKTVHIGMDEAHMLGLGKYLEKHGYQNRFDILSNHLNKVVEIAEKHGLECIMWSDMFFRLATNGDYYDEDNTFRITDEIKAAVNKKVQLVYWDYYHTEQKQYGDMIEKHKRLSENPVWFAGGAWSWLGFTPHLDYTLASMLPAMQACRAHDIDQIILTMWGDNGAECSKFALLPALYHIKCAYDGVTDLDVIKENFRRLTGESYDDMLKLGLLDQVSADPKHECNASKFVLYGDLFNSFLSNTYPKGGRERLISHLEQLEPCKSEHFGYLFDNARALCEALILKYDLADEIRAAYDAHDVAKLKGCVGTIEQLTKKIRAFYETFRKQWHTENLPNGFDVQDQRIGGLLMRLSSCQRYLTEYLDGSISSIPELEQKLLPAFGNKEMGYCNIWSDMVTANIL